MTNFERRRIEISVLPLPEGLSPVRTENTILKFSHGRSIDFGSLCYLTRSSERRPMNEGRGVDISSFRPMRRAQIATVISRVIDSSRVGGHRPLTLYDSYSTWYGFMDWCDNNGHLGVLDSASSGSEALRAYIIDTRRLVDQHVINSNTACAKQFRILDVLEEYFGVTNLSRGINLLTHDKNLTAHASVPDEIAQGKVLSWCTCIQVCAVDIFLNKTGAAEPVAFPYALTVPPYAGIKDNIVWLFPFKPWWGRESAWGRAYDYDEGRIRTLQEIIAVSPSLRAGKTAKVALKKATLQLENANTDHRHRERVAIAFLGMAAFFVQFLACTGANASVAVNMPWSEDMERSVAQPLTERQGFRTIKYRAGGREVSFEIGVQYIRYLRSYLGLRRELLQRTTCPNLFFSFGKNDTGEPRPAHSHQLMTKFYSSIRGMCTDIPELTPRQWRAAKQDFLMRQEDLVIAANMMQHSLQTAIRNYSNGSETAHQQEMGAYLLRMQDTVLGNGADIAGSQLRSLGICISPRQPEPAVENPAVTPDCERSEGCLFCTKYRVHADEVDTRKLLSARHCIRIVSQYAENSEVHEKVFGPTLKRIDFFVGEIKVREPILVKALEHQVDVEGELDAFWLAKLESLMQLGMDLL